MKFSIIEQTPKLLKLQLKPQAFLYWLFGGLFVAGGIFLMLALGKVTTFSCSRIAPEPNSCQLMTKSLSGTQIHRWNIKDIQKAKTDTSTLNQWYSYPLIIQTSRGYIAIDLINADFTEKEARAAQINTFLKTPQEPQLIVYEDSRLWSYPLGLFLIASGAVIIIYRMRNGIIICVIDKSFGKITINRKSCFGNEALEVKLADVVGIKLDTFQVKNSKSYNVSFKLASDKYIYIAVDPMFTAKSANKIIENIASFTNIQFLES
ncbi:hypothetical protein [Calothrix sp. UHCC 0171]|uniref:hypothetical protein n=1 Tax=Calothrix sp. UHCC 0171 TaxID=3110245 RepID=UPI002B1EB054|nr:hypothetical protein [Calothrix sp. UHCC 0171]MEA5572017.1 hypothetical protein [Calothrix sp. UHCC 0171]